MACAWPIRWRFVPYTVETMSSSSSTSSGGIGVAGLLGVAFIVLKLCHIIDWSWWWVLSPFWIGLAIILALLLVIVIAALIKAVVS